METGVTETANESRHKCLIYDGNPAEQLPVVIPFLTDSLHSNWRCLYLGSPEMVHMVDSALIGNGTDVSNEVKRGALVFSSDRSHLKNGAFEPGMMVDSLCTLVDHAVEDGFEGLCATGDMAWELGNRDNFDRLVEYEARLEQVFQKKPLRGICQYRRDLVPAHSVRDALVSHRSAYIGHILNRDNLFYIPPELLLEISNDSTRSKQGEWMCQQIIRVLNAEQKRDQALTALQESEAHQRRLAEQLAEMNRNLERRVEERTEELEIANRHLEAFSYSVSHDLRGPARRIRGFTKLLGEQCEGTLQPEAKESLDIICSETEAIGQMIEDLLRLSKSTVGELRRNRTSLSVLAQEIVSRLSAESPDRSVEVRIEPGLTVHGDRGLLGMALENLLSNAWKYSSKRDRAVIEFGEEIQSGGARVFFVRDNGAGFDMRNSTKLFVPFQRLHTQSEFVGTGVGLSTVQRIVSRHGGKIWAEAERDKGATFYFTIPAGDAAE